jgi:hypothetical protein
VPGLGVGDGHPIETPNPNWTVPRRHDAHHLLDFIVVVVVVVVVVME